MSDTELSKDKENPGAEAEQGDGAMHEGKRIVMVAGLAAAISLAAIILATVLPCGALAAPAAGEEAATSPKVHELVTLLVDPKVQEWLKQQDEKKSAAASGQDTAAASVSHALDFHLAAIREHIIALARTVPDVPNQFERGHALVSAHLGEHGRTKALLLLAVFVGLGSGVEWLFRMVTRRSRARLDTLPLETVRDRLRLVALRFAFAFGLAAAFALGSVGPFLALDWPPLVREQRRVLGDRSLASSSRPKTPVEQALMRGLATA